MIALASSCRSRRRARRARSLAGGAQGQAREFTINGNQFAFAPARIEVQKDDLVKITFTASDMAHSFIIDNPYRIAKRAGSGQTVTFEFRADQAGTFPFYCNLTQDDRCRQMKGERRKVGRPFRVAGGEGDALACGARATLRAPTSGGGLQATASVCPRDWASSAGCQFLRPFIAAGTERHARATRAQPPSIQRLSRSAPRARRTGQHLAEPPCQEDRHDSTLVACGNAARQHGW